MHVLSRRALLRFLLGAGAFTPFNPALPLEVEGTC
jgi:hypothetical protein